MAKADVDRNLLFGILAVQMDFITRDALIAAMNAWVLDKQKPLAQVLVEQGALSATRRILLDGLIAEHLAQHDNDPAKSLIAISTVGSVRKDLEQAPAPDVQASPAPASAARAARDDAPFAPRASAPGPAESLTPRFRILRPH